MRNLFYTASALLVGSFMWLGIWIAAFSALYQSRRERKLASAVPRAA